MAMEDFGGPVVPVVGMVASTCSTTQKCCGRPITFTVRTDHVLTPEEMAGWELYYQNTFCRACEARIIAEARSRGQMPPKFSDLNLRK